MRSIVTLSLRYGFLILFAVFLVSCSASQHAGKVYKKRPAMTEKSGKVWFEYWQDQFDGRNGKVAAPGKTFPEAARNAYNLALEDRKGKEGVATMKTVLIVAGGVGGIAAVLAYFLL